jgi:hypothetical protein
MRPEAANWLQFAQIDTAQQPLRVITNGYRGRFFRLAVHKPNHAYSICKALSNVFRIAASGQFDARIASNAHGRLGHGTSNNRLTNRQSNNPDLQVTKEYT